MVDNPESAMKLWKNLKSSVEKSSAEDFFVNSAAARF